MTAIPAVGRENYGLLQGIEREAGKIFVNQMRMLCCNKKFRNVALEEPKKYFSSYFYRDASKFVKELKKEWSKLVQKYKKEQPQHEALNTDAEELFCMSQ